MIDESIRRFLTDELSHNVEAGSLSNDYPLLEGGVLDSLGLFQLVAYLEGEFGVEIDDEELVPENFGTVSSVTRLVEKKRSALGSGPPSDRPSVEDGTEESLER